MIALEHQVRFSKLHEKRAEVIAELFQRLVDVHLIGEQFVFTGDRSLNPHERFDETQDKIREFILFVEGHQIYLPARVCELLNEFIRVLRTSVLAVGVHSIGSRDYADAVMQAFNRFEKDIPEAKQALVLEFRKILGEKQDDA